MAGRLLLGGGLALAGFMKVGRLEANVDQVRLYELPLPLAAERVIGYTQPFLEITVGLLLLVGLFTRVTAALAVLAMVIFISGISWAWANGLQIDCGCFTPGGTLAPGQQTQYGQDIARDLVMMAGGVWLFIRPRSVLSVDNWLFAPVQVPQWDDQSPTPENDEPETEDIFDHALSAEHLKG